MIRNMDSVRLDRYIALYSSENGHNEFGDSKYNKDNLRDAINEASAEKFKEARSKMIAAFKEKFGNENEAWHAEGYNKYTKSFLRRGIDNIILGDDRLIGGKHLRWYDDFGGLRFDFMRGRTELEYASDQFIEALRDDIDGMYRMNDWDIRNAKSEPKIDIKYYEAKDYAYKVLQDELGDSEKVKKMKAEAERVAKEAEEKARQDAEIEKERAKSNEGLSIAIDQATEKDRQAINDRLDEAEKEFRQASEKLHRMSNQQDTCSAGSGTCRAQGDTSSFSNEQKTSSALDVIDKELKNLKLLPENENKVRQTLFEDPFIRALKEDNVQQLSEEANTGSKNPYSKVKPSSVEDIKGKIITTLGNKLGNRVLDRIMPVMGMYNLVVEHNKVADDFVKQQKAKELIDSLEGIPQADKLPENQGTSIDNNKKTPPNIEINTGANKQEPLSGFIPVKTTDGLKGSTIHDQNFDDFVFRDVKVKNGKIDLNDFDLTNEEEKGHTIERHVGKTQEYLEGRNIKSASMYSNLETANRATKEVLKNNEKDVVEWFKEAKVGKGKRGFETEFEENIGHGIKKGEQELAPKTKARVVLKKVSENEFTIITSYPID